MDTRQAIHSAHAKTLDTEGLRREFLITEVFRPGELTMTYSHIDRIVVGGVMPLASPVRLPEGMGRTYGVDFFLQRREMGIINIGGPARIVIDGETLSRSARRRRFTSAWARASSPSTASTRPALRNSTTTPRRPTAPCPPVG